jgi:hypothetical protein
MTDTALSYDKEIIISIIILSIFCFASALIIVCTAAWAQQAYSNYQGTSITKFEQPNLHLGKILSEINITNSTSSTTHNNSNSANASNNYNSTNTVPISNDLQLAAKFIANASVLEEGKQPRLLSELKKAINLNDTLLIKIPFLKKALFQESRLVKSGPDDYKIGQGYQVTINQDDLNLLMKIFGNETPGWNHGVKELGDKMPINYSISNKYEPVGLQEEPAVVINSIIPVIYENSYYYISTTRTMLVEPENSTVIIKPILTIRAYQNNGFYDFFRNKCSVSCLTIKINDTRAFAASAPGLEALRWIGYSRVVTDADVDQNPSILSKFKTVIVLHNEYVTKREFDAITSQKHVVYLYPNAMFAEVTYDPVNHTITLTKGHRYPLQGIWNAFNWKYDNTYEEKNHNCVNWKFKAVGNGRQLNCTPDNILRYDSRLWYAIKHLS